MTDELPNARVRWLARRDLVQIIEIDNEAFASDPWTPEIFLKHQRGPNCLTKVAVNGAGRFAQIIGYAMYSVGESNYEIVRMAVSKEFRRKGIGSLIWQALLGELKNDEKFCLEYLVHESCLDTQLFLKENGAIAVDIIGDHYLFRSCLDL